MNLVAIAKKAQEECDRFNAQYPIGTNGVITKDVGKPMYTCLKHPAQVMGSSAVAFFEGISGAYLLERFEPNEEPINTVPEKETNSLRDKVKDAMQEYLGNYEGGDFIVNESLMFEGVPELADAIFDALGIEPADQDKIGAKVCVNPKILITVQGGLAEVCEYHPADMDISIRDYDLSDFTTDEELADMPTNESGDKYIERF